MSVAFFLVLNQNCSFDIDEVMPIFVTPYSKTLVMSKFEFAEKYNLRPSPSVR